MRINIINVKELTDQHLTAEYREIKMLPLALVKSIKSKKGLDLKETPREFTLNTGHGKFFYNKIKFIENRFEQILVEMRERGFKTDCDKLYQDKDDYSAMMLFGKVSPRFYGDYTPTEVGIKISKERIKERILTKELTKPKFYKYYGKNICDVPSVNFY